MKHQSWQRVASELGRPLSPAQTDSLTRYRDWIRQEAIPAGLVGPGETDRLEGRHLADSLLFIHGWDRSGDPETLWDLGSGAGLPGIPLAVMLPGTLVTLIDRSRLRVDLLRRVIRILGLENVAVLQRDINQLRGTVSMMVSRATVGPETMTPLAQRHLVPGGVVVIGGSWVRPPVGAPGWNVKEIPADSLDRPIWLLIMRR